MSRQHKYILSNDINALVVRLNSKFAISVACVFVMLFGSLDVSATSRWSEGAAEFQSGTALNVNGSGGDLRLGDNLAYPANWTHMLDGTAPMYNSYGYSMIYDNANDTLVLYDGNIFTTNLSAFGWVQSGAAGPVGRREAAIVYDPVSDLVVLFGGSDWSQQYGTKYYNDTWVYNVTADNWTQLSVVGAPSPRSCPSMSFDPESGLIVLFGGEVYNASQWGVVPLNDTFTLNVSAGIWTRQNPATVPSARSRHAAAFAGKEGEVVVFGGWGGYYWNGTAFTQRRYGDTWTYNVSSDSWTNSTPTESPEGRTESSMIYDSARACAVLFGGSGASGLLGDTWTYDAVSNSWTVFSPAGSPSPQCRYGFAYDSAAALGVLFTGRNEAGNISETWTYDTAANKWTNLVPPSMPSARSDHAMAYDPVSGDTFLFGGAFVWGNSYDVWCYNSGTNKWTSPGLTSPVPPARKGHTFAYDARNGLFVLFGGQGSSGMMNDTWTYDPDTNMWTEMKPASYPQARAFHSMVYDSVNGAMLLFGGQFLQYWPYQLVYLGDTWTYNLSSNAWSQKTSMSAPSVRMNHAMAYDTARGTAVLYGGAVNGGYLGDTWTRNSTTGIWVNVTPVSSPRKGYDFVMLYGGPSCEVMLFGGWNGSAAAGSGTIISYPFPSETWVYRASTNTWTNRPHPSMPAPRFSSAAAFDIAANSVVLFGGYAYQSSLGDTWQYGSDAYFSEGTYTSRPFDTGGSAYFGALSWNATLPADTYVRFQMRGADSAANLSLHPFSGPGGTGLTYNTASGQHVSWMCNGSRWVQYRAYLRTDNVSVTPLLSGVTMDYNLLQSVSLPSPLGGENWTGTHDISWTASDLDNDALVLELMLVGPLATTPLAMNITDLDGSYSWNTSAVPNGTYRIRLVSRDNSTSIPLGTNYTSPEFTVFHPAPPNHVPAVTLLSPVNGSVVGNSSVWFGWTGNDLDGDRLSFNLTYWTGSIGNVVMRSAHTNDTTFNATGLKDNATYYWNVSAFDGWDISPPSPVWQFAVDLNASNRPPVITSIAQANASVGVPYEYQLTAEDTDNDTLTYTLLVRPDGMTLGNFLPNGSGISILWTPTNAQRGDCNVTVEVTDGHRGRAVQTFSVHVEPIRPKCAITTPATGAAVKSILRVNGTATAGSGGLVRVEVRVDGGEWKVAAGTLTWTYSFDTTKLGNGNHTIEARATDGELTSEPVSVQVLVKNAVTPPKQPGTTLEAVQWPLLLIVLLAAGAVVFFMYSRGKKDEPSEDTSDTDEAAELEKEPKEDSGAAEDTGDTENTKDTDGNETGMEPQTNESEENGEG